MRISSSILFAFVLCLPVPAGAQQSTVQSTVQCAAPGTPFGGDSGTPQSIVDSLLVTDALTIQDLQVTVRITHSYVGDIVLDLMSPVGTSVRLHDSGGGNADDLDLVYDDEGVANGTEPYDYGCVMQPAVGALSVFDGEGSAGVWTLSVTDDYPTADDGVLEEWCVRAFDTEVSPVPAITELSCAVTTDGAELSWTNGAAYDAIVVTVDGAETVLPGDAVGHVVSGFPAGAEIAMSVTAVLSGSESCAVECSVVPFELGAPLTERVVLVILDGLRYSEGLGHPTRAYVPNMSTLASAGTIIEPFLNDGPTVTVRGIPAILCGSWDAPLDFFDPGCNESNQYSARPMIHEYYRRQLDRPASDCVYLLGPYCPWRGSFHPAYGPDVWPQWIATSGGDDANWSALQSILTTSSPRFITFYLPDVDSAGHGGNWNTYLAAIQNADQIIGQLWATLQQHPDYAGRTTMLITNDHGRHDYDFQGHGDGCDGCRTIQLLAVGPGIREGHVSMIPRSIPDVAPTIGALLGLQTEYADGDVMDEILHRPEFIRGDTNADAMLDIADPVATLAHLFSGGPMDCRDAADANDDGGLDISDAVSLLAHLFGTGAPPPEPSATCGLDPTPDTLGCAEVSGCP